MLKSSKTQDLISDDVIVSAVTDALSVYENGELFYEDHVSESIIFENGKLRDYSHSTLEGVSLRGFSQDRISFAHSPAVTEQSIISLADKVKNHTIIQPSIKSDGIQQKKRHDLYSMPSSMFGDVQYKIQLLHDIDKHIRSSNSLVKQVRISLNSSVQDVAILKRSAHHMNDRRPLISLSVLVVVEKQAVLSQGYNSISGRVTLKNIENEKFTVADQALQKALVNLEARPCPGGMMPVILGNGIGGILLHEAIGHGLEGDFIRKKMSAFHDLQGKQVAAENITVIDSGMIKDNRGSLNFDDEGTVTQETVLIENGILSRYMQDNMNAKLMNTNSTGNCRRENYSYQPMPRMTNTYMSAGDISKDEIISGTERAIYAVSLGGGQVDITNGKFVFNTTEAYLVENGKIKHPVKDITIIGDGATVLKNISMVADDLDLNGTGTCGKDGQWVPVGVGQPTIKIDEILVGGTQI